MEEQNVIVITVEQTTWEFEEWNQRGISKAADMLESDEESG